MATTPFRADFKICGPFSGTGKEASAAKWLRRLEWDLEGYAVGGQVPPHRYTQALDLLLTEDAATWAENHPTAADIFAMEAPTKVDITTLKGLLCERFPSKSTEISAVSFDIELMELKQSDETLLAYYKRLLNMMSRVGAKDRSATTSLNQLEAAMLNTIMRAFLKGLTDPDVRREAIRGLAMADPSLKGIYNLAEEARRTKAEVNQLTAEDFKTKELEVLRKLVASKVSKTQLDNLISSYQAHTFTGIDNESWLPDLPKQGTLPANNYGSRPHQTIAQNPNRQNGAGPDWREDVLRKPSMTTRPPYRPQPRELPDKSKSKNPYINGTMTWSMSKDGPLCVRCGSINARKDDGHECQPLPAWEQSYLREIVFGTAPQVNFASVGYGEFDGRVEPWGSDSRRLSSYASSSSSSSGQRTPWSSTSGSPCAQSITFGFAGLQNPSSKAVEAKYGEGSGSNKRPHLENQPQQAPQQPGAPFMFQAPEDRPKLKGKKRTGKKVELQPLVGMFNEQVGNYDSPISIRQVLQTNRVDMSWMDLVAWSPAACKELKRLCTRVPKKRATKAKAPQPQQVPFQPQFYQPMPPMGPIQPVPQTFQPFDQQPFQTQQPFAPQQPLQPFIQQPFVPQPQQPQQEQLGIQAAVTGNQATVQASLIGPDAHTKFLSNMMGVDRAFHIPSTAQVSGINTSLDKSQVQADQGSDLNVISPSMCSKLRLDLLPLSEVGFKGLSMRTADHRDSLLEHYVSLNLGVEGVWRTIRMFVSPTFKGVADPPRILLGIPWLYSVNAIICIRQSSIQVGDPSIGEAPRYVTGPEMVFHKDHMMLMYPKACLADEAHRRSKVVEVSDDEDDESSESSEDDLSDIDEQGL